MILALSSRSDDHFLAVEAELEGRGAPPILLDLAEFPAQLSLAASYDDSGFSAVMGENGRTIDLTDVKVAWWRRPQPFTIPEDVTDEVSARFAYSECYHAITGIWSAIGAEWVNRPMADDEASHKPYQLAVARELGLSVPKTLISSDPAAVRRFVESVAPDKVVFKAFGGTQDAWRETRVVGPAELDQIDDVRFAPVIFQEFVPAVLDLRVTVIGGTVIASQIDSSDGDYKFDYRAELGNARIATHDLPVGVAQLCTDLVRRLGLVYGAIDLRLRPDGEYVFLEINPSGQWLFMEQRTGQPITRTFCDQLLRMSGAG